MPNRAGRKKGSRKVSIYEEQNWLDRFERGDLLDDIARQSGRATSTLWKGIERARRRRDMQAVHHSLLADSYRLHFDDLLSAAKELRSSSSTLGGSRKLFNPDETTDGRASMLQVGIRDHIPKSPLWKACSLWEDLSVRFGRLRKDVRSIMTKGLSRVSKKLNSFDLDRESFVNSFATAVEHLATYPVDAPYIRPTDETPLNFPYKRGDVKGASFWGAHRLAANLQSDAEYEKVENIHTQLFDKLAKTEIVAELQRVFHDSERQRKIINAEVETLLLRRILPGSCKFCPQ